MRFGGDNFNYFLESLISILAKIVPDHEEFRPHAPLPTPVVKLGAGERQPLTLVCCCSSTISSVTAGCLALSLRFLVSAAAVVGLML